MSKLMRLLALTASLICVLASGATASASLPSHAALKQALATVVAPKNNSGFGLETWATIVNREGKVHAVTYSGKTVCDQWLGSRVVSAQKANTANAFSLAGFAVSTANLYGLTQPGGSLFGLQESNPVDAALAYKGLGVSGDTSCTDHTVAWKLRHALELDYVPAGFGGPGVLDNLVHGTGKDAASHPTCDDGEQAIMPNLPVWYPVRSSNGPAGQTEL